MRTNLFFVRHAHSVYTPEETRPLSERGMLDTKYVTEILKEESIDYVISSPYKRAIQTVQGIANDIGKEMIIEENLKERVLSINPVDDFNQAIFQVWADYNFTFEGGESNHSAQLRGINAMLKILDTYEGKNIVIGTHGNMMVLIMNYFDKKYDFNFWKQLDMPDIYKLTFEGNLLIDVNRLWNQKKEVIVQ